MAAIGKKARAYRSDDILSIIVVKTILDFHAHFLSVLRLKKGDALKTCIDLFRYSIPSSLDPSFSFTSPIRYNPLELEEVIHHIHDLHEDKSTKVIEWLIDNDKIRFASGNLLEWIE